MESRLKPRSSRSRSATAPEPSTWIGSSDGSRRMFGSTCGNAVPRRSRRARGADTTRRRSAPGHGAAEDPARWRAAPAASRPRRGRGHAEFDARPREADRRRPRRGSRKPLRRHVVLESQDRYPCLSARAGCSLGPAHSHGMGVLVDGRTQSSTRTQGRASRGRPLGRSRRPAVRSQTMLGQAVRSLSSCLVIRALG